MRGRLSFMITSGIVSRRSPLVAMMVVMSIVGSTMHSLLMWPSHLSALMMRVRFLLLHLRIICFMTCLLLLLRLLLMMMLLLKASFVRQLLMMSLQLLRSQMRLHLYQLLVVSIKRGMGRHEGWSSG